MERNERARGLSGLLCATAATTLLLTGCAGAWSVPEGGEPQFQRDALACERDATAQSPAPRTSTKMPAPAGFVHPTADYTMAPQGLHDELGTASGSRAQRAWLVDRCMEAKGYRRQ
jgi:hypothetical protein